MREILKIIQALCMKHNTEAYCLPANCLYDCITVNDKTVLLNWHITSTGKHVEMIMLDPEVKRFKTLSLKEAVNHLCSKPEINV